LKVGQWDDELDVLMVDNLGALSDDEKVQMMAVLLVSYSVGDLVVRWE
jgi:hypothetical protein